jgi:hypothetical protein
MSDMSKYLTMCYINIGLGPHSSGSVKQIKADEGDQWAKKEVQKAEGNFGAEVEGHQERMAYAFAVLQN